MKRKRAKRKYGSSVQWRAFLREIERIGPREYGEFNGPRFKVTEYWRMLRQHIKKNRLALLSYTIKNDNSTLTLYVVGK